VRPRIASRYRGAILGGAVFLAMLVIPSTSYGWSQFFSCGVLAPGGAHSQSGGPPSLDRAQSWYPGPAAHHVRTCVYIWNHNATPPQVRGGVVDCEWSDGAGTRIADVPFGPTTAIQYRAFSYNAPQTCCAHTVDGWTKTTY
jgi:hypothetical protein